jgi:ABC-type branched-subunit amino acid transport system substrate-binding protein
MRLPMLKRSTWGVAAAALGLTAVIGLRAYLVRGGRHLGGGTQFRIGAILPLSGPSARYGKWIQEGLELAREEVNAAGGIGGRPLQILYEDDQATPRLAATAMQKLATSDRVPVVFGSWASSSARAPSASA